VGAPGVPDGGLPAKDGGDLGGAASAWAGGGAPLAPGAGFCTSPPLAALGGDFGSSAISVDAYGKAPFSNGRKHEFLHMADKHVNRREMVRNGDPLASGTALAAAFRNHGDVFELESCQPHPWPLSAKGERGK
jgi:hypothetical protein